MPLLLCPNDNGPMQTVNRSGVEFDMCPQCRGVWLDRGELEKLMALSQEEAEAAQPQPQPAAQPFQPAQPYPMQPTTMQSGGQPYPAPPPQHGGYQPRYHGGYGEQGERGEYGERGERGEHGHYGPGQHGHRKRGFGLFDIFD